jgi:NAD(P)-dependent dehydrogenase (short-subunit alcohol dehydrogenase family)
VVFISSVNGRLSMPLMGAYAASKFALEAAADALRMELRPWRIPVVLVEPGQTDTDMWRSADTVVDELDAALPVAQRDLYRHHIAGMRKAVPISQRMATAPERVSAVVQKALTTARPRARYVVGAGPRMQLRVLTNLPVWVRDRVLRTVMRQP